MGPSQKHPYWSSDSICCQQDGFETTPNRIPCPQKDLWLGAAKEATIYVRQVTYSPSSTQHPSATGSYGINNRLQSSDNKLFTRSGVPQGNQPIKSHLIQCIHGPVLVTSKPYPKASVSLDFRWWRHGVPLKTTDIQSFLNTSRSWAENYNMTWSMAKSCGLLLADQITLAGERL